MFTIVIRERCIEAYSVANNFSTAFQAQFLYEVLLVQLEEEEFIPKVRILVTWIMALYSMGKGSERNVREI